MFLFFKQKTAYEMRISYWSSDVCSSDLIGIEAHCQCARDTRHALQVCIEAKYRAASTDGITADAFEHAGAIMQSETRERRMQAFGTGDFAIEPSLQRRRYRGPIRRQRRIVVERQRRIGRVDLGG